MLVDHACGCIQNLLTVSRPSPLHVISWYPLFTYLEWCLVLFGLKIPFINNRNSISCAITNFLTSNSNLWNLISWHPELAHQSVTQNQPPIVVSFAWVPAAARRDEVPPGGRPDSGLCHCPAVPVGSVWRQTWTNGGLWVGQGNVTEFLVISHLLH